MTQRLDPGAGWYGEFLRRDPQGLKACLDGAAIPPWDVVESLLRDLAGARGAEFAARETVYAAQLRAAAVTVWDRLPGGEGELRTLLAAAVAQRAESQTALRSLTVRLGRTADRAETDALARELSWAQDDVARAAARHEDLAARLRALRAAPGGQDPADPLPGVPGQREPHPAPGAGSSAAPDVGPSAGPGAGPGSAAGGATGTGRGREDVVRGEAPVGRAEGRWLRGARRSGGARYAGSAAPAAPAFTPPPGHPGGDGAPGSGPAAALPAPRGARFGVPEPAPDRGHAPGGAAEPRRVPPAGASSGAPGAVAAALLALRAQGRSGEAHALLCEAAARPAEQLPALADELTRAGLAADWATLLWEAASLPPERLAAAAAALGAAGREADCDALLRQGVARPAAEVAAAALVLGGAGRIREADALLGAFVRVRTAEEAAGLARHDPPWFVPRLLRAARVLPGPRHRDLLHALRVAGIAAGRYT
ncbi:MULTISPECIES: hypothetical protein [Streptomyces]|uniref:hypothetical protein n=1 Tax=Streptomyces TaxID=1883 RepID=UPI001924D601|nr:MULTISPECIES: hypothetical protein [Streptomyces]MCM9082816.1 hypothetical protein [Streptomyces spororaveus]MCX5302415.1 hypothetical protein [Streptomyces sp. NBC_00160]